MVLCLYGLHAPHQDFYGDSFRWQSFLCGPHFCRASLRVCLARRAHRCGAVFVAFVCGVSFAGSCAFLALSTQCFSGSGPAPCFTVTRCHGPHTETLQVAWGLGTYPAPALPPVSIFFFCVSIGQFSKEELIGAIFREACCVPE